jgi:hypothetical protein
MRMTHRRPRVQVRNIFFGELVAHGVLGWTAWVVMHLEDERSASALEYYYIISKSTYLGNTHACA